MMKYMSIFNFENYRFFLKKYLLSLSKKGRGEINRWAEHLRVNASLISQIMGGSKEFTIEQANALAEYLGLTPIEMDYFIILIQIERAGTHKLKKYFQQKAIEMRTRALEVSERVKKDRVLTDEEKSIFYSSWIYSAVRMFCSVNESQSIESIGDRFQIERERVIETVNFLVEAQLLIKEGIEYKIGPLSTHLERTSSHVLKHHSNWRVKAIQHSDFLTAKELMYTSPISLSREDFQIIREGLVQLIQQVVARVKESPAEDVACLNLDFFWVK